MSPPSGPEKQYLDKLAAGRFEIQKCAGCGRHVFYPRVVCPHCGGDRLDWVAPSGRGTVYSWSTMQRVDPPYTLAYVTLAEGPTMLTNLVGSGPYRIGMPVQVQFQASEDGTPVPVFAAS